MLVTDAAAAQRLCAVAPFRSPLLVLAGLRLRLSQGGVGGDRQPGKG